MIWDLDEKFLQRASPLVNPTSIFVTNYFGFFKERIFAEGCDKFLFIIYYRDLEIVNEVPVTTAVLNRA